jgi:predicted RNA-binding protein
MQCLLDPNHSNLNNLNNVSQSTFQDKKREYLKAKINKLKKNSTNKNIRELYRGISDFKKGYQPRTNIVQNEKDDLVADSHSILAWWRNYFSQLWNVHGDNDVRQTEIHTAEPLVPEAGTFDVETEKFKSYKSPNINQIPAEMIKAGGSKISSEIHHCAYL